ncbi:MAG: cytochrome-c oxidase, cbb3-type subunit III [Gammaproteobacteria bacterium]|nr:cytochrome-c oxidase, cbb3-type subunit III [Gammaproteobacteria bacterium]
MADFNSEFWSWFISAIVVGGFIWMLYLLQINNKAQLPEDGEAKPTGHVWDEDLQELNTPLPRWWLYMFYITIVFGAVYLALYPGLGSYKGVLGWSSVGEYEAEVAKADAEFGPLYDKFLNEDLAALATSKDAMRTGERLYVNYCAVCHGSDARGAKGFPNLRDNDWLYGGDPETIKTTIMYGRTGAMPAWEGALGGAEGVAQVAEYVQQLAGRDIDADVAEQGKAKFDVFCVACHTPEGTGIQAMGAPNLTDNIWLYGGSAKAIKQTIAMGREGRMPAHAEFLGEAKVHILAAYIYSLSNENE